METFSRTRPIIGAFAVGAARSAMEFAIDYAKKRRAFGMKLAQFEAIQFKLAEMFQKVETSRLLVWKGAWEADNGIDPTISASISKFYATEAAMEVVNEALQIFGGYGYTTLFPIEKLLRDIRLFSIYEGTSEVQRLIVSGYVLNGYKPVMPPLEDFPLLRGLDLNEPSEKETPAWRCLHVRAYPLRCRTPRGVPLLLFPEDGIQKGLARHALGSPAADLHALESLILTSTECSRRSSTRGMTPSVCSMPSTVTPARPSTAGVRRMAMW